MGKLIIDNGWADMDYVEKYTYGFEQYKALVDQYPLDKVCEITGLDADKILEATRLYATNGPACTNYSASALVHHINGFNSHRAIVCLSALTGNFDRVGGNIPNPPTYLHKPAGFKVREHEFRSDRCPPGTGADRRPAVPPCGTRCMMSSRRWICCVSWRREHPIPSRPSSAWA